MAWKATLSALAGHVNVSLLSEDGRVEVGGSSASLTNSDGSWVQSV